MVNSENEKDIAKSIRRAAINKNWKLFRQSKLGMVGLYIVIFFFFTYGIATITFSNRYLG